MKAEFGRTSGFGAVVVRSSLWGEGQLLPDIDYFTRLDPPMGRSPLEKKRKEKKKTRATRPQLGNKKRQL